MSDRTARTVLGTGAARRLGRAIALALARGGWQVAVHYRGSEADRPGVLPFRFFLSADLELKPHLKRDAFDDFPRATHSTALVRFLTERSVERRLTHPV